MFNFTYVKNKGENYFELLKLSRVSESINEKLLQRSELINSFNSLPEYRESHKRLIPLLKHKAHKLNIFNDLTPNVQKLLNEETKKGIVTELAKANQLSLIFNALANSNIPIILLKGAAFNKALYSDNSPRTSNDIDILVKKEHWNQAISVFDNLMAYQEKNQPDVFGDLYEVSFIPKGKVGASVDLHKALIHQSLFEINEDELWNSSIKHCSFNNELIRTLSPEHALIHQAIHAYKDMDFAKYNMVDTYEIIHQLPIDFEKLCLFAKKWNATTPLYILLVCNMKLMRTVVSYKYINKLKPNKIIRNTAKMLLVSPHNQAVNGNKTLQYRVNQIVSQFIFTGNLKQPVSLILLYMKSLFIKSFKNLKLIK